MLNGKNKSTKTAELKVELDQFCLSLLVEWLRINYDEAINTCDNILYVRSTMCKEAKQNFYQQKITENVGDQKVLFKVVNDLLYKEKETSLPSTDSKEELAKIKIADFFANKIERIVSSFVISESLRVQPSQEFTGTPFTKFQQISEDKLREVIMSGNSKCCHLNPIPTSVLKEVLDHVLPTLTILVNKSLQKSFFPHKLKSASVVPLLKKAH